MELLEVVIEVASVAAQHILGLEDEHVQQMNRLTRGVDALLSGPYNAAVADLEIAAGTDTSPESAVEHLAQARRSFTQAYGNLQKVEPLQSAWAAVHLAIISVAMRRRGEALQWAVRAHDRAAEAMELLVAEVNDKADLRVGLLRLTSENAEANVAMGGAVGLGVGAAAAGVTIASGGLALVVVGAAFGAVMATSAGLGMIRRRQMAKGAARVDELRAFLDDIQRLKGQIEVSK